MRSLTPPIRLSVAAPAYNEAEGIEAVITEWHAFLSGLPQLESFEIVICNDGSKDKTGEIMDRLTLSFAELRPLHFAQNQGAAAALNAALEGVSQFQPPFLITEVAVGLDNDGD